MSGGEELAIGLLAGSVGGALAALLAEAAGELIAQSYPQHCPRCKRRGRTSWPHRAAHQTAWFFDAAWWAIRDKVDPVREALDDALQAAGEAIVTAGTCAHNVAVQAAQWAAGTVGRRVRAALPRPTETPESPEAPKGGK